MAYDYTIPYISREEYLEAKGIDLATELQDDDNRSNKVNRFIHDITNFVLDYLTTEYKCNELNRITHNFADLAEQRRVRFHYGMIEQIEYILNNGLIHQNMGYNPETGGITDFSGVQICHGALQNFRLGGFCNMQRRSMPDCLTPADMPTIQELVLELAKKVDKVDGKGLSTNDFTEAQKMLLKNLSIEIDQKVDKVSGKGLSSNDFTNEFKQKLLSIAADAEANVIEEVCVNNSPLPISGKKVNVDLSYLLSESDFESWRSNFVATLEGLLNSKEDKNNKVTSLSAYSTDTEYPTAKATFDAIQAAISGVYQFVGAKTVAQLNALGMDSSMNGYVYNVLDGGNLRNGNGSTVSVVAGDNVAVVWDFDNNTFSWDKLAGEFTIDLNDYYTKPEVDALLSPKADSDDVYTKTEVDEFIVRKENKSNKVTSIDDSSNDTQYPSAKAVYALVVTELESYYTKSETNTLLNAKQDTLTFDDVPTVNSNNPVKSGGVYKSIQNVREVAEGKCRSFVISYQQAEPTEQTFNNRHYYRAEDGSRIETWSDFVDYLGYDNPNFGNASFNSQNDYVDIYEKYLIADHQDGYLVVRFSEDIKTGDIVLVQELDVPDRWYDKPATRMYKLETNKIDLTNYVDLGSAQTITGEKTITSRLHFKNTTVDVDFVIRADAYGGLVIGEILRLIAANKAVHPTTDDSQSLGLRNYRFKDLFLSGVISDGTNTVSAGEIAKKSMVGFPVITAPSSTTLTDDEILAIQKGCQINGTFLNLINPTFYPARTGIAGVLSRGMYIGHSPSGNQQIGTYQINESTKVIGLSTITQDNIDYNNVGKINGKTIPAYPSSTGTYVLKCVDGVLDWVQEN